MLPLSRSQERPKPVPPPTPKPVPKAPAKPAPVAEEKPYEPRDSVFFVKAACMLAAALCPQDSNSDDDHDQADESAAALAQILDGGPPPKDFVAPRQSRLLIERRLHNETLAANNPAASSINAGQVKAARDKLAEREKSLGKLPEEHEILDDNAQWLARLADLSEPVRDTALSASAVRLSARKGITGARLNDAALVVVEEIERAIRFAEANGVPSRSIATEEAALERGEPAVIGPVSLPYPSNVLAAISGAAADEDESDSAPGDG